MIFAQFDNFSSLSLSLLYPHYVLYPPKYTAGWLLVGKTCDDQHSNGSLYMLKIFRSPECIPIEWLLSDIMDTWWGCQFWLIYVAVSCFGWPEKFTSWNPLIFRLLVWSLRTRISYIIKTSAFLKIWLIISAFDFVIPSTFSCTILRLLFKSILSSIFPGRDSWFVCFCFLRFFWDFEFYDIQTFCLLLR